MPLNDGPPIHEGYRVGRASAAAAGLRFGAFPTAQRNSALGNLAMWQRRADVWARRSELRSGLPLALLIGLLVGMTAGCGPVPEKLKNKATGPPPPAADAETEFHTTESGLKYRMLRHGKGVKPTARDRVIVHYKGWLDDGKVFDSSYRSSEPVRFFLNQVVEGWREGLQYVAKGGMIELEVPPRLGYGLRGQPPSIPGNATLHFIVELIEVEGNPFPAAPPVAIPPLVTPIEDAVGAKGPAAEPKKDGGSPAGKDGGPPPPKPQETPAKADQSAPSPAAQPGQSSPPEKD